MPTIALDELNAILAKPGTKIVISFNPGINRNTRAGFYITTTLGLLHRVFFVGTDLESGKDIIEVL